MDDGVPLSAPPPRQTLGYIRDRLAERGIGPKSKLGQNFLIDLNLLDVIVSAAELSRDDLVLEIGCGTGSLTARLVEQAGAVLGVEIDRDLFPLVSDLLDRHDNLQLLQADALRTKNELNPAIFAALDGLRAQFGCRRLKLVSNLPYAVATPVIANLMVSDHPVERMVVTVQWEIAERLTAQPGTAEYAGLAVLTGSLAEVRVLRRLPPNVFWPRPQVESAIVLIRPDPAKRAAVGDVAAFRNFLRDLYVHKRKSLRAALIGWPHGRREKGAVDRLLAELGLRGATRAQELDPEQHLRLCRAFGGGQG